LFGDIKISGPGHRKEPHILIEAAIVNQGDWVGMLTGDVAIDKDVTWALLDSGEDACIIVTTVRAEAPITLAGRLNQRRAGG